MRSGLRICGARGHSEVRQALIRYAKWLRKEYEFPIRLPVYISSKPLVTTVSGESATASFFAPYDREVEPFIRIASGDYLDLKAEHGRDNALAAIINSLSHEIVHYKQWVETGDVWERGVGVKATGMLRKYSKTVDRP